MVFDKAIHSRRVVLPNGIKEATIFIKKDKIVKISVAEQNSDAIGKGAVFNDKNIENVGDAVVMAGAPGLGAIQTKNGERMGTLAALTSEASKSRVVYATFNACVSVGK